MSARKHQTCPLTARRQVEVDIFPSYIFYNPGIDREGKVRYNWLILREQAEGAAIRPLVLGRW
jgi:hypothetical protein